MIAEQADIYESQRLRQGIDLDYLRDEDLIIAELLEEACLDAQTNERIMEDAARWVKQMREQGVATGSIEAFLQEYSLTTEEGVILMCLAESLLRIPDVASADQLIRDRLAKGDWDQHLGQSSSVLVNAATWGMMFTGHIMPLSDQARKDTPALWQRIAGRLGEPVVRTAMQQAMRIMGKQFVMGETIGQALERAHHEGKPAQYYSFDMLGEAALTAGDADRYYTAYREAIDTIASHVDDMQTLYARPGISVKLSALHPRYEFAQRDQVNAELTPRLLTLAQHAKNAGISMTLDAEECDRLTLSLTIFQRVYEDSSLKDWNGFGLAIQAYHKRARAVVDWVIALARHNEKCIPVRLVKGAYWDAEIKQAQQNGLENYPVFTRKQATDISYRVCAKRLLDASDVIYPQFATHNARTIATIQAMAIHDHHYEFQRLHGMGETLYAMLETDHDVMPCRVYAPVGGYESLLPYLVRRLLENGANTSFINRIWDEEVSVKQLIADPVEQLLAMEKKPNPRIPLPEAIYGSARKNSQGINLNDEKVIAQLLIDIKQAAQLQYHAVPLVAGEEKPGEIQAVIAPHDLQHFIGNVTEADVDTVKEALNVAVEAYPEWERIPAVQRAEMLEKAAELLQQHHVQLLSLVIREAGKTIPDAVAELREAVDFCRYYAAQIRKDFAEPLLMPGPTGEKNELHWCSRGVFVCISPWNFPLAIFTGQLSAALAAGNCVIAKPAHQTALVSHRVISLMHEAGIPPQVLQCVPCKAEVLSESLIKDHRIAGVAFTGSTETAWKINRTLAGRACTIVPLIAETGGQNAMIVDSTALPEQVVKDVIRSAFNSAGQRCSALRVLFLQNEIAERVMTMIKGAMAELRIGDPMDPATDVGPVIDKTALDKLLVHVERFVGQGKLRFQTPLPEETKKGFFIAPTLIELTSLDELQHEVFGPILHVVRYDAADLDDVISSVNDTGYGLTLGIHSRIEQRIKYICEKAHVGNIYVNRDMVGAVVGVQPFGGEGLSGTGFKAGGPRYLYRFATERTVSVNMVAMGGNTQLLSLGDNE